MFNALIETGVSPAEYAQSFDSISICLSKGLGAPVGSLLLGNKDFIERARRRRKSLGGGMRQAGIIAAAGLFALKNNIERLRDDHQNAKHLGDVLLTHPNISSVYPVQTNIVIAETIDPQGAQAFVEEMKQKEVLCFPFGPNKVRFVTHLGIDRRSIDNHL